MQWFVVNGQCVLLLNDSLLGLWVADGTDTNLQDACLLLLLLLVRKL